MSDSQNETTRIQLGEAHTIRVLAVDAAGAGVTGATVVLKMRRDGDGFWFNGTTFQASFTSVNMSQLDSTNMPGVYVYTLPGQALSQSANLVYTVTTATAAIINDPWWGEIKVGQWVDYINSSLSDIAENVIYVPATLANTNLIRSTLTIVDEGVKGVFRVAQDIVSKLGTLLIKSL